MAVQCGWFAVTCDPFYMLPCSPLWLLFPPDPLLLGYLRGSGSTSTSDGDEPQQLRSLRRERRSPCLLSLCWLQPTASTAARPAPQQPQLHEWLKDVFVCIHSAWPMCC